MGAIDNPCRHSMLGACLICATASAQTADVTTELALLRSEIASLKSQNGDKWLTEERAAEIKSLVKDVLADSETRTSLQGSGATSGYDDGFFIASADGNFRLSANFLAQARFTYNHQAANDTGVVGQEANSTWGFENRRTGMAFTGNVVDPSWTYAVRFNYGSFVDPYTPGEFTMILQDAWGAKDLGNGYSIKIGQFKSPFMAESLRDDGAQLTAERSVVDYYFSGGYTQGVAVDYSSDRIRATGSYNNGPRVQNGNWASGVNNSISLAGRFEFKAMGAWSQFDSESAERSDESALRIGAAIQYYNNRGASASALWFPSVRSPVYGGGLAPALFTTGAVDWTVDVVFKSGGLSLSGAFIGANYGGEFDTSVPAVDLSSYGAVIQAGFRCSESLECFGRWEWLDVAYNATSPDGSSVRDVDNYLTFGVSVYGGPRVKWTMQFGISTAAVGDTVDLVGAGYRVDNNTNASDQFNIITQLQVGF